MDAQFRCVDVSGDGQGRRRGCLRSSGVGGSFERPGWLLMAVQRANERVQFGCEGFGRQRRRLRASPRQESGVLGWVRAVLKRQRPREQGQVLVGAIAFIAFFAVVAVSVGRWVETDQRSFKHTETVASGDGLSEGEAAFAAASAARADSPSCSTSSASAYSRLSFGSGGDVLQLKTAACPAPGSAVSSGGANCAVCILDSSSTNSLDNFASFDVTGDVYVNGGLSVEDGSSLTTHASSTTGAPGAVLVHGSTSYGKKKTGTVSTPSPSLFTPSGAPAIADPLASTPPAPILSGAARALPKSGALTPGIYAGGNITGSATLSDGIYVFTGAVKDTGNGDLTLAPGATGVLLYFTCGGSTPAPCNGSSTTGLQYNGNGKVILSGMSFGPDKGMTIFYDRTNASPLTIMANGNSQITGTIYAPQSTFTLANNSLQFTNSRIIVDDLVNNGGGTLTVGGSFPFALTCAVIDSDGSATVGSADTDIVNAQPQPTTYGQSRVVVQTACSGGTGIVDFNYGP